MVEQIDPFAAKSPRSQTRFTFYTAGEDDREEVEIGVEPDSATSVTTSGIAEPDARPARNSVHSTSTNNRDNGKIIDDDSDDLVSSNAEPRPLHMQVDAEEEKERCNEANNIREAISSDSTEILKSLRLHEEELQEQKSATQHQDDTRAGGISQDPTPIQGNRSPEHSSKKKEVADPLRPDERSSDDSSRPTMSGPPDLTLDRGTGSNGAIPKRPSFSPLPQSASEGVDHTCGENPYKSAVQEALAVLRSRAHRRSVECGISDESIPMRLHDRGTESQSPGRMEHMIAKTRSADDRAEDDRIIMARSPDSSVQLDDVSSDVDNAETEAAHGRNEVRPLNPPADVQKNAVSADASKAVTVDNSGKERQSSSSLQNVMKGFADEEIVPTSPAGDEDGIARLNLRVSTNIDETDVGNGQLDQKKHIEERRGHQQMRYEEEVERGIERVLMAILDRANSGDSITGVEEKDMGANHLIEDTLLSLFRQEGATGEAAHMMHKGERLSRPSRQRPPDSNEELVHSADETLGSKASMATTSQSVVEELLAENDEVSVVRTPKDVKSPRFFRLTTVPTDEFYNEKGDEESAAKETRKTPTTADRRLNDSEASTAKVFGSSSPPGRPPLSPSSQNGVGAASPWKSSRKSPRNEQTTSNADTTPANNSQCPPSLLPYSMSTDGMMGIEAIHINMTNLSVDEGGNKNAANADMVAFHRQPAGAGPVPGMKTLYSPGSETTATSFPDSISDNDDHFHSKNSKKVLGPLSKKMGGTTGIVLDIVTSDDVVCPPPDMMLSPTPKGREMEPTSPDFKDSKMRLIESLTTAATSRNMLDELCRPLSQDEDDEEDSEILDKYSSMDDASASKLDSKPSLLSDFTQGDEVDPESIELMQTLCAHLLPVGLETLPSTEDDEKSSVQTGYGRILKRLTGSNDEEKAKARHHPPWDEDNPDEPGYIVHKLTRSQLRHVERAFEGMVNRVRQTSERRLLEGGAVADNTRIGSSDHYADNANPVMGSQPVPEDGHFERDLEEAEQLLDQEEKRYKAEEKAAAAARRRSSEIEDRPTDELSYESSYASSNADSSVSDVSNASNEKDKNKVKSTSDPRGHPDFPNVLPSGRGKPNSLEFFNLPIIHRTKQTGFEPTKDLVMEPGEVLAGQYLVQSELGSAAFSTAYRCIDLSSSIKSDAGDEERYHEEVCLKVIKNTKDFFDQSLDEIKILQLLRETGEAHEHNVVEMKTFFYHREHLVIVTELLRQNLFEFGKFISDNKEPPYFTQKRLSYITRQVLVALKFVHEQGLVHSDIKPENILLASYSKAKVKVIDFGSSCYLTDRQSSYIQSRSYRAPEVILGLPYDGKIDIWSLGCVVAEMYTGEVTFQNESVVSMLSRIEAICGTFPRRLIAEGRHSDRFFTASGLLYEKVNIDDTMDDESELKKTPSSVVDLTADEDDDNRTGESVSFEEEPSGYNIFQPKMTTMAARLGFDADLMEQSRGLLEEEEKAMFVDFIRSVLTIDPESRPTAAEALEHPWILSSLHFNEKDIRYPPEE